VRRLSLPLSFSPYCVFFSSSLPTDRFGRFTHPSGSQAGASLPLKIPTGCFPGLGLIRMSGGMLVVGFRGECVLGLGCLLVTPVGDAEE
jgi:hypothetical protein